MWKQRPELKGESMRKAIQLKAILWIEGEDAPAHDFAQSTMQAVQEMLAAGGNTHPELQVTLKALTEETDWDAETSDAQPATSQPIHPVWSPFLTSVRSVWARLWPHESPVQGKEADADLAEVDFREDDATRRLGWLAKQDETSNPLRRNHRPVPIQRAK